MHDGNNSLVAIEDAVARLLSSFVFHKPSIFHHPLPKRVSRDEVIPLLTEIDEDLRLVQRISESLAQIKTWLLHWRGRTNGARPVSALPVELLSNVFDHVHDGIEDSEEAAQAVMRLSHVTSPWRAVALAHGALWTNINIQWNFARQDEWLKRSKRMPLRILSISDENGIYPSLNVEAAADHIESIIAYFNYEPGIDELFPDTTFPGGFPALRHIELDMGFCDEPYSVEPWILDCSRLQHVTLRGVTLRLIYDIHHLPPLPWIELQIVGGDHYAREIFKLLSSCQQLHTLVIRSACIWSQELKEVEELQAQGTLISGHCILPLLKCLDVKTCSEDDCTILFISRFVMAPTLTVFGINSLAPDYPSQATHSWECLDGIGSMLGAYPHLNTIKIQGRYTHVSAVLNDLALHAKSSSTHIPNLAKLVIGCGSGEEEIWSQVAKLIAARFHAAGCTTNALEELELVGAPGAWH